ncbi:flagellar hook-basal body complex protein FliE [Chromobacterium amazonense]|uniref:flagellar hook-basal body complex protein FliE n=1 Tax=Chromobacterium amazonense TaxID=1382803 RepID=UPI0031F61402
MQPIESVGIIGSSNWWQDISWSNISPNQGHEGDLGGFSKAIKDTFNNIDKKQHDAANKMVEVDSRVSDDLVGAMLASQEANLSFAMLVQVRNKLVSAVDDILKMPV